jgi:hypothetical protein
MKEAKRIREKKVMKGNRHRASAKEPTQTRIEYGPHTALVLSSSVFLFSKRTSVIRIGRYTERIDARKKTITMPGFRLRPVQ